MLPSYSQLSNTHKFTPFCKHALKEKKNKSYFNKTLRDKIVRNVANQIKNDTQVVTLEQIIQPVEKEVQELENNLKGVVGLQHPMLMAASQQIFKAGGKKLRPVLCLLISRATARLKQDYSEGQNLLPQQLQLAKIAEMIYAATQVHDEVLDEDDTRVIKQTRKPAFGTRLAVLAGDYLFAQSSWQLANLDNLEVIRMISQVIADYANSEIEQEASLFQTDVSIEQYLQRSFYKTSSLIAASYRGAAAFNDADEDVKVAMYDFGKHLGFTIQIVEDIQDLESSGPDLQCGIITAPAVYSLKKSSQLVTLIENQFSNDGDYQQSQQIIQQTGGIDYAKELALQEGNVAKEALNILPDCPEKQALQSSISYVLQQLN